MTNPRKNFTNRQKAEIFALDHALCSMSGKSLWILDHGAAPSSGDWCDHIVASASGGKAEIENGACASWLYNWVKRDHKAAVYLFHRGRPTEDFFMFHELLPESIAQHLHRFSHLHWSDWHFNRCLSQVLLACRQKGKRKNSGEPFTRDRDYWARSALNHLEEWRKGKSETTALKVRGLIPKSLTDDQRMLLSLSTATSVTAIKKVIVKLAPLVQGSATAMTNLAYITDAKDAKKFLREMRDDPRVVQRTKHVIKSNIALLYPSSRIKSV